MTKLPILHDLFSIAAASSFLTKLVKPGVISRAKIAATGLDPLAQTWQRFSPASGPVTFNGLNGLTLSPGCNPAFRSAPKAAPANRPATAMESKCRFMGMMPFKDVTVEWMPNWHDPHHN
jgi:hypothetical protein